jgi:hypothetical protein
MLGWRTIVVWKLDRLARSIRNLLETMESIREIHDTESRTRKLVTEHTFRGESYRKIGSGVGINGQMTRKNSHQK